MEDVVCVAGKSLESNWFQNDTICVLSELSVRGEKGEPLRPRWAMSNLGKK
jgi:hypothetical protein